MTHQQNRTLGAFEKTFWLLDQIDSKDFALGAEIEGTAPVEAWQQALVKVQERHPNLAVRVIMDKFSRPILETIDNVEIPFRVVHADNDYRWTQEVEKELPIRFDTEKAPLIRIVVVQKPTSSVLIVVSSHIIADGTAVSYLIRDILQAVTGKELAQMELQKSNDETLGFPEDLPKDSADQLPISDNESKLFEPKLSTIRFSEEITQKIIERARKEQTTVHGALCAAVLTASREMRKAWADKKIEMITPICSRKALHLDDNFGLNITTHPVYFEGDQHLSFWEVARMAKEGLAGTDTAEHVKNYLAFFRELTFDSANIAQMLDVLKQAFNQEIMVTNLGRLKYATDFGALKLKSLYGPMVRSGKGMEQTIGANCVNGSLCLTNTSDNPIPKLLEKMEEILTEVC